MMKAENYLVNKEKTLIDVIGRADWKEKKIYYVDEIVMFMEAYHSSKIQALKKEVEDKIVEAEYFKSSYSEEGHTVGKNVTEKVIPYEEFMNIIANI